VVVVNSITRISIAAIIIANIIHVRFTND